MSRQSIQDKLLANPRYSEQVRRAMMDGINRSSSRPVTIPQSPPRKFRNVPCEGADGAKFDSKKEKAVYDRLCAQHGKENVVRQVSIPIGARRIRPDFMVIFERFDDGTFRAGLIDAKGMATDAWKIKAEFLKVIHGIAISTL